MSLTAVMLKLNLECLRDSTLLTPETIASDLPIQMDASKPLNSSEFPTFAVSLPLGSAKAPIAVVRSWKKVNEGNEQLKGFHLRWTSEKIKDDVARLKTPSLRQSLVTD